MDLDENAIDKAKKQQDIGKKKHCGKFCSMLLNGNISKTTTRIMMEQVWQLSDTLKAFTPLPGEW